MGKTRPGLPMLTKQKPRKNWQQPVFMQQGLAQSIKIYAARNLPDRDSTGKEKLHQDHMMEMALNKRILLAEGKMEYAGYYTIPFNEKIVLDQGEKICYNSGNKNTGYCSSSGH